MGAVSWDLVELREQESGDGMGWIMPLGDGRPRSREHGALGFSDGYMWGRAEVRPRPGPLCSGGAQGF